MIYLQKSFGAGQDLISSDVQVAEDGYVWLVNGRTRFGRVQPTRAHDELTGFPEGNHQGTITVGNVHFLFISGLAYYRIDETDQWIQVANFEMDDSVERLYSIAVPASTFHFVRKLNESINNPLTITVDFKVAGTPAGILVQDGVNQPWIIQWDEVNNLFIARVTKKYAEWVFNSTTPNTREYVPIGKQMMMIGEKLYIVSPDNKKVFQSVSGRPLDFMVNVDENGAKLQSESQGGAASTAFAFDFDDITCIKPISAPDSFIYGTSKITRLVQLDFTRTIFGEPRYNVIAQLSTGIVNQDSVVELTNGDIALISPDGVKSFNAVEQLQTRSNGDVFSLQVSHLLTNHTTRKPIKQVNCRCVRFDNYALFNLDTYWGNIIVTYDMLKKQWISLDITHVTKVKQFAIMESELEDKLFCVTEYDEVFQMYSSDNDEKPAIHVRGMIVNNTEAEQKSAKFVAMFQKGTYDGQVFLTEYVDDQLSQDPNDNVDPQNADDYRHVKELAGALAGIPFPVIPPVVPNNKQRVDTVTFPLTRGLKGKKLSFILQWTNDSQLIEYQLTTAEDSKVSLKQQNQTNEVTYAS